MNFLGMDLNVQNFCICLGVALLCGGITAVSYRVKNRTSQSFLTTLLLLPPVVCALIIMINGNIGTGIAVAGAFSLVRFRSAQGSGREISAVFLAMTAGLITGAGYIWLALLFTIAMCQILVLCQLVMTAASEKKGIPKILHITIPESLDYEGVFEEVLEQYTSGHLLTAVKTSNMGSLFKLTYEVTVKKGMEKKLLDDLRVRNGNLEISLSIGEMGLPEL